MNTSLAKSTSGLMKCLETGEFNSFVDFQASLTLSSALFSKPMRGSNRKNAIKMIVKVVSFGLKPLRSDNKMNQDDIVLFASDFYEKHEAESLEDLAMCFKMARQGYFGTDYNRIDSITLFRWFSQYLNLKYEEKERQLKKATKESSALLLPDKSPEADEKMVKEILDNVRKMCDKKAKPKPRQNTLSYEKYAEYISQNVHSFTNEQLKELYKDMYRSNKLTLNNQFNQIVNTLKKEIEKRKLSVRN